VAHLLIMTGTVSIVVPVFNGIRYLPAAVDSILHQSYDDLDIVLVDGGSTDGSRDWIRTVEDRRIRIQLMPEGTTAADNWTTASRAAIGEYVKLLCQDDLLYPTAIELQVADLESHPEAHFSVAQRDIVDSRGRVLYARRGCARLRSGLIDGPTALRASYSHGTNIFGEPLAILFRREPFNTALSWDDERPFLLDLELYTRMLLDGPIAVRRQSIGAFRVSSSSWSTRLVRSQTEQLRSWQREVEGLLQPRPNLIQRQRADLMRAEQMMLRRLAYRVLKLRKSFQTDTSD